ncbi:C39 family peptidase [Caldimonas tepidiphila]|uniref:C39 family peptidase n=1 Tax=Caldimonas tepidiphila TaxID=2315841 RepID=UPI000E5A7668|nr:C39 family peptidase [Caldimonas tepidiphila]
MKSKFLLIGLLVFSAAVQAERPVRSLLERRHENVIIQQWDNSCGAAALATVLTYYRNFPVSEKQVAHGMLRRTDPLRVRYRGGFSLLDMKRYVSQLGFESEGYEGMGLEDLAGALPMIVPLQLRGYPHFVVVRKVGEGTVSISDPSFGNYEMRQDEFAAAWPGLGFAITGRPGNGSP